MTSFVDRLFLSPEELCIVTEISAITNPTVVPISPGVICRAAETLQQVEDPLLQNYAVRLLTEPFLDAQDSWRGVIGVCSVLIYLAHLRIHLNWLSTIVKLCGEISEHFEHEDARVASLVRREATNAVNEYDSEWNGTQTEALVVEGKRQSISIPTWEELSAEDDALVDEVTNSISLLTCYVQRGLRIVLP